MSIPLFNVLICCSCSTPPNNPNVLTDVDRPISWKTSDICFANSLVGTITKQRTPLYVFFFLVSNTWSIGMAKAPVFPVPVWAIASTSSPSKIGLIALNWISVGLLNPRVSNCDFIKEDML